MCSFSFHFSICNLLGLRSPVNSSYQTLEELSRGTEEWGWTNILSNETLSHECALPITQSYLGSTENHPPCESAIKNTQWMAEKQLDNFRVAAETPRRSSEHLKQLKDCVSFRLTANPQAKHLSDKPLSYTANSYLPDINQLANCACKCSSCTSYIWVA